MLLRQWILEYMCPNDVIYWALWLRKDSKVNLTLTRLLFITVTCISCGALGSAYTNQLKRWPGFYLLPALTQLHGKDNTPSYVPHSMSSTIHSSHRNLVGDSRFCRGIRKVVICRSSHLVVSENVLCVTWTIGSWCVDTHKSYFWKAGVFTSEASPTVNWVLLADWSLQADNGE